MSKNQVSKKSIKKVSTSDSEEEFKEPTPKTKIFNDQLQFTKDKYDTKPEDTWFKNFEEEKMYYDYLEIFIQGNNTIDTKAIKDALVRNSHQCVMNAILLILLNNYHIKTTPKTNKFHSVYIFDHKTTIYKLIDRDRLQSLLTKELIMTLKSFIGFNQYAISNIKKECIKKAKNRKNSKKGRLDKNGFEMDSDDDDDEEDTSEINELELEIDHLTNILQNVETAHFMKQVISLFCNNEKIYDEEFEDILDSNHHVINFKNRILDNKTGKFRKRTPNDYYTKTLDFNYNTKYDKVIYNKIDDIFTKVCNNDEKLKELMRRWFGYCMTGDTSIQVAMWVIGHLASNGKSTLISAFVNMFSIYTYKLHNETFNKNFKNRHKQFSETKNMRFLYVEEQDKEKLDVQIYKDILDGIKIAGNEILYGTAEEIKIFFKLMFASNKYPNITSDRGTNRRTACVEFSNVFQNMDKLTDEQKEEKNKRKIYEIDTNINSKEGYFTRDDYKLGLFHYLLFGMKTFYEKKFKDSGLDDALDHWRSIVAEGDHMKIFLDATYDITENPEDRIHKDEFTEQYKLHYPKLDKISWLTLLGDVKTAGLQYDPQLRSTSMRYDSDKKSYRNEKGSIVGIKLQEGVKNVRKSKDKKNNLDAYDVTGVVIEV